MPTLIKDLFLFAFSGLVIALYGYQHSAEKKTEESPRFSPTFKLIPSDTFYFKSFVDCNMAEAWIGDTFRIFPGPTSPAAVCRIGIMKSVNGGYSWENRGIFLEDYQPRLILKPHNQSNTFPGGVGDPSAVTSGYYLYLFYGEYSYPGSYDSAGYDPDKEWSGQCISIARILLNDLDQPEGKARRWDGKAFTVPHDGVGVPIPSLHSQEWTEPQLLFERPGYFLWYPSLQPFNSREDIENKNTCLRLGQKARLFIKNIRPERSEYMSMHIIEFSK